MLALETIGGAAKNYSADFGRMDDIEALEEAVRADHHHLNALLENGVFLMNPHEPRASVTSASISTPSHPSC